MHGAWVLAAWGAVLSMAVIRCVRGHDEPSWPGWKDGRCSWQQGCVGASQIMEKGGTAGIPVPWDVLILTGAGFCHDAA